MDAITSAGSSPSRGSSGDGAVDGAVKPERSSAQRADLPRNRSSRPETRRKTRRSDPNRARTQRNAELRALRREAEELSAFLSKLSTGDPRGRYPVVGEREAAECGEGGGGREAWKEICMDQAAQKARAERENFRLRRAVEEYTEVARSLHRFILKSARLLVGCGLEVFTAAVAN